MNGALIFGGSRGIGQATAELLAANGWYVTIADVLEEPGEAIASEIGGSFVRCDVSDPDQIAAAFASTDKKTQLLKLVFNNVGIARYGTVEVLELSDWQTTFAVNVTAQFLSAKYAIPRLRKNGGGVIINTASILAHASQKMTAAYSASKAAVLGLTRTIAIDHAHEGIRAVSISPGTIDTPLVQIAAEQFADATGPEMRDKWAAAHPIGRLGEPTEVAAAVLFLAGPGAGFITGSDILIDGGVSSEFYK
jgi:NAD(P)-dependent dehydrogenase (short-subunit alcohol dehydrogenase family)